MRQANRRKGQILFKNKIVKLSVKITSNCIFLLEILFSSFYLCQCVSDL